MNEVFLLQKMYCKVKLIEKCECMLYTIASNTTISMIENKMFEKFSQLRFILLHCGGMCIHINSIRKLND